MFVAVTQIESEAGRDSLVGERMAGQGKSWTRR